MESLHTFVQWTFNGKEVDDSRRIKKLEEYYGNMGNFTLSIVNVTGTDEGLYTCKVYFTDIGNKLPAVRINLTVEGKICYHLRCLFFAMLLRVALSNFRLSPEILTKSNLSNFVRFFFPNIFYLTSIHLHSVLLNISNKRTYNQLSQREKPILLVV